ncbi:MAG: FtsK/SpoIIIE domain-containing protein [Peptostreptococcaceae bacterium]
MDDYSLGGYNWKKWERESEEKRDISPKKIPSEDMILSKNGGNEKMSDNIIEPLVDAMINSSKLLFRCVNKFLGGNTHDFRDLFEKISFKNKYDEYPKLIDFKQHDNFDIYLFRCPIGICMKDFEDRLEQIIFFIGEDIENIRLERCRYNVALKVITNRPKGNYDPLNMKRNDFKIPLGYDLNTCKMVYWDLIAPSNTHCYIAGSSGGGKSIALRLILCHLINSKSKRDIELSIINTKRVDLKEFEKCKHTRHYMTGTEDVEEFLEVELDEMERRYRLLEKYDCDDLTEYREKVNKIPYRLIVVEEISSYKGNKPYQRAIELLASQGRGAGMLLLLVTQLPSHEIMPNTIKCNINTTIGLKTKDSIRSEIIAGPDSGLEKLKGNGHSKLFDNKHDGTEYQGLYISKDTMKEIINNNLKQNKRAAVAGTTTTLGDNKLN